MKYNINKQIIKDDSDYLINMLTNTVSNLPTKISDKDLLDKKTLEIALNNLTSANEETFFTQNSMQLISLLCEKALNELSTEEQSIFRKNISNIFSKNVQKSDKFHEILDQLTASLRRGRAFDAAASLEGIRNIDFIEQEQGFLDLLREPKFLLSVIEHGDLAVVLFLMDYMNIDLDTFDSTGKTPLLHLLSRPAGESKIPLQATLMRLLQLGVDVNRTDRSEMSPLHYAVLAGDRDATRVLYKFGADPYALDKNAYSPIDYALTFSRGANEAVTFLLTKILKFSVKPALVVKEPSAPPLINTTNFVRKYQALGSSLYENMQMIYDGMTVEETWLTRADVEHLKLLEHMDSYGNEAYEILDHILSIPLCMVHFYKFSGKKQAFEKIIHNMKQNVAALEDSIDQTADRGTKKKLTRQKEDKIKELADTLLQMKNELKIAKTYAIKNSIKTGATAVSVITDSLNIAGEENQRFFIKALGTTALSLTSGLSVYQNWNEIKDIERKTKQLALTKINLMTNYSELEEIFLKLPAGLQSSLTFLKLKQLEQKIAHIESELGKLGIYKSTFKYSTIGHCSSIILLTAAAISGNLLAASSTAGMLASASTFAPIVVGGSYATIKSLQKWKETASDSLLLTLDKCQSMQKKVWGLFKPGSLNTQEKAALGASSYLDLKLQAARNLGLPLDKLEEKLNRLDTFLSNDLKNAENHIFMRQVLEEAGIDTSSYDLERKKLILLFLNK